MDRLREPPPPPDDLGLRARDEWIALSRVACELGVLTNADLRALRLLAESLELECQLRERLRTEGLLVSGNGGVVKSHPALRALEAARAACMKLLGDFGLSPRSRSGVDMAPARAPNAFANHGNRSVLDRYTAPPRPWETS